MKVTDERISRLVVTHFRSVQPQKDSTEKSVLTAAKNQMLGNWLKMLELILGYIFFHT